MSPYLLPANDAVSLTSLLAVDDTARRVEHGQLLTPMNADSIPSMRASPSASITTGPVATVRTSRTASTSGAGVRVYIPRG